MGLGHAASAFFKKQKKAEPLRSQAHTAPPLLGVRITEKHKVEWRNSIVPTVPKHSTGSKQMPQKHSINGCS